MINGRIFRGSLAAGALCGVFVALMSAAANARDPGLGVGRPGPGVYPAAPRVAVVGAPVYALPHGCVAVVVNGVRVWRCGTVVYRSTVQAGRTVYVVVP